MSQDFLRCTVDASCKMHMILKHGTSSHHNIFVLDVILNYSRLWNKEEKLLKVSTPRKTKKVTTKNKVFSLVAPLSFGINYQMRNARLHLSWCLGNYWQRNSMQVSSITYPPDAVKIIFASFSFVWILDPYLWIPMLNVLFYRVLWNFNL